MSEGLESFEQIGGQNSADEVCDFTNASAATSDGAVLVTGRFCGTTVFGRASGDPVTLTADSMTDGFLVRYRPDGALDWVQQIESTGNVYPFSVAALADGSVVVSGAYFWGSARFGDGATTEVLDASLLADWDLFIARYDAEGRFVWARRASGPAHDSGLSVAGVDDGSGAVLLGGTIACISEQLDCSLTVSLGTGTQNRTLNLGTGAYGAWAARYDASGVLEWVYPVLSSSQRSSADATDFPSSLLKVLPQSADRALVVGLYADGAVLMPGSAGQQALAAAGGAPDHDIYLAGITADGALEWTETIGGPGLDYVFKVARRPDASIMLAGSFERSLGFGAVGASGYIGLEAEGQEDLFLAHLDEHGQPIWVQQDGGGGVTQARGLALLADGGSLVSGSVAAGTECLTSGDSGFPSVTAFFGDPSDQRRSIETEGECADGFVAEYDPSGEFQRIWPLWSDVTAVGLDVVAQPGRVFTVSGVFWKDVTLGRSAERVEILEAVGAYDAFMARYRMD